MSADRIVVGLDLYPPPVLAVVIPVEEGGAQTGHEPVGDVARARDPVVFLLGKHGAEYRHGGTHHVHGVRGGRHLLERAPHLRGQPAKGPELFLVARELGGVRQLLVDEQVGDLLELGLVGEIEDVVAAVVQVVAAAADGAQRGVAGGNPDRATDFLGLVAGTVSLISPSLWRNSSSSLRS